MEDSKKKGSHDELEKGWKEGLAGAALISGIATATVSGNKDVQASPYVGQAHSVQQPALPKVELRQELRHIAEIESSGGKNKNHAQTTVGLNAGQTAAGSTGLMPLTVKETLSKNPTLNKKYGHLAGMEHSKITEALNKDPSMEADIANTHWQRLDHVFGSNQSRKAYAWRNGISAAKSASDEKINSHPYVQKYMKLRGQSGRDVASVKKSEELTKMSRPVVQLPHFTKVGTRNDQEVQPIETTRQKDMYGRKVANAELSNTKVTAKTRLSGSSTIISDKQGLNNAYSKRISGKFDRNTLGLSADTGQGSKSAAITGALRSKFEDGDDDYKSKLAAHTEKRKAIISDHNTKRQEWRDKAYALSNKISEPGSHEAYNAHLNLRPEAPKLPRRPSKPKVDTKKLSPEQQSRRGRAVDSTIHHEAFHHTMAQVEHHYGKDAAKKVHQGLLSQFHPDTLASVGGFIHQKLGYKMSSPKFTEEVLAHSRDILVNPKKRESYSAYAGDKAAEHIKNLKVGHQKAVDYAKNLKPEHLAAKPDPIKKTASIGHGAIGAPGDLVGASALATESVGGKLKRLKKKLKSLDKSKDPEAGTVSKAESVVDELEQIAGDLREKS